MNDDLRQLEAELERLSPRAPDKALRARLEKALDPAAGPDRPRPPRAVRGVRRRDRWSSLVAIAAGLLFAVGVYFFGPFQQPRDDGAETRPEDAANGSLAAADATLVDAPAAGSGAGGERPEFEPVRAENALKNRIDEGLVVLDNGLAARRYRFQFIDTVTWKNPQDGSEFEVATPREEVVLVPVHTF